MAFKGHGAPAGFETRGMMLDGTEIVSGGAGVTDTYKDITFDPTLWKAAHKNKFAAFLRFKCAQIVYLSSNGTGDADFEANTWHRVPIGSFGKIKAAAVANLSFIVEVA